MYKLILNYKVFSTDGFSFVHVSWITFFRHAVQILFECFVFVFFDEIIIESPWNNGSINNQIELFRSRQINQSQLLNIFEIAKQS